MSVELILEESRALSAALACVQGTGDMEVALRRIEPVLEAMGSPSDVAGLVTQAAMKFITGHHIEPPDFTPSRKSYDCRLFETTAKVWIHWASQTDPTETMRDLRALKPPSSGTSGALHVMAVEPWKDAVEALFQKDAVKARRLFWKASELGSQLGTESNPAVQWSFAASFFFSPT